jgi:hypothetical protein
LCAVLAPSINSSGASGGGRVRGFVLREDLDTCVPSQTGSVIASEVTSNTPPTEQCVGIRTWPILDAQPQGQTEVAAASMSKLN